MGQMVNRNLVWEVNAKRQFWTCERWLYLSAMTVSSVRWIPGHLQNTAQLGQHVVSHLQVLRKGVPSRSMQASLLVPDLQWSLASPALYFPVWSQSFFLKAFCYNGVHNMRQLPCQFASFLYIATPDRMSIKMWGMFDRVSDRMPDHVPGKMSDLWKVRIFMR